MSLPISFREVDDASFEPAAGAGEADQIDSSFTQSPKPVGPLRITGPSNGRYESKHPIFNPQGETIGFLVNGASSLGYTFTCVSAGDCLWITHQWFGAVTGSRDVSGVSLVAAKGGFWFGPGAKFEVVKSFRFGGSWPDDIKAYKLLDQGRQLLYLTNIGVCLFDTCRREIVRKTEFTDLAYRWSGFGLSPKVKVLAMGCSVDGAKDLVDGEPRYNNFIRLYDFEKGQVVGEQPLPGQSSRRWAIEFSSDGRRLRAASGPSVHLFELRASQ